MLLMLAATGSPQPTAKCGTQIGVFNELALQRFDLILAEAARNGIYVIFPMVDGDAYLGGPEWYYEQATPALMHLPSAVPYTAWKLASSHAEPARRKHISSNALLF